MKKYKQLSLFEKEENMSDADIFERALDLVDIFEDDEEFKEIVDNRLDEILKLCHKFIPEIIRGEQLYVGGELTLSGKYKTSTEDGKDLGLIPNNIEELNSLIIHLRYSANEDTSMKAIDVAFVLVQEYYYILSAYKELLGVKHVYSKRNSNEVESM